MDPAIRIVDPLAVRAGRVSDNGQDWIVLTFEYEYDDVNFEVEPEAQIALTPDDFVDLLTAGMLGLGFPQSDTDYVAERYKKEFR
jgi:hypothetical protein